MAKLVVKEGRGKGAEHKLCGDSMIMGRRSVCPIPIADPKASREHAVVRIRKNEFFLQDLSRNGTSLNGAPVVKSEPGMPLKFGDQIRIGDTILELIDEKAEPVGIDIPGYEIIEKVGSGGMGIVYKAKQLSMDRIVALKVLNERYTANSEFVDRFIREARAAGKLNHPNVIHVHDISRHNDRHYFSMEFVDGSSVKEVLRAQRRLDFKKSLDVVLQCARALEFAHENQIIHRDIKPDNIMLTKEGIVKIADLGIAKTFEEAAPAAREHRRVMGTPHYMAPEQALGKEIDNRADIYSLGATFYHMVTGSTPFNGSTAHEILKAHIQESLPAIQDINPSVPDPVCFVIERMMAKLPEKRYASMSKVIEDIERVQAGAASGIDQIEAGDSTIMRAVRSAADEPGTANASGDAVTGLQPPMARFGLALLLTAVFAVTVVLMVLLMHRFRQDGGTAESEPAAPSSGQMTPPPPPPLPPEQNTPPAGRKSNPEAKKLLENALAAAGRNDLPLAEAALNELLRKFPASLEGEEAGRQMAVIAGLKKKAEQARAEGFLAEARKFEAGNPGQLADCIDKYKIAMAGSAAFPQIYETAKARHDELRKRLDAQIAQQQADAFAAASAAAKEKLGQHDYDGVRAALGEYLKQNAGAPQKNEAQALLAKANQAAAEEFAAVKAGIASAEIPAVLALLKQYRDQVKDAQTAEALKAAFDGAEERARKLTEDEVKKACEKAKLFQYKEAADLMLAAEKHLAGTRWAETVRGRAGDFQRQKNLYERALKGMQDALKSGPAALNFPIASKFGNVKWRLEELGSELPALQLKVGPVPSSSGPGCTFRLDQMAPKEQYDLQLQFLPKPLTSEDHKDLAAFCGERGLAAELEKHSKAASPPDK